MIQIIEAGAYKLIETKGQTKIIYLNDNKVFAWVNVKDIGEILVTSHHEHIADCLLAVGNYRIYEVENEPDYSDQLHLELSVGKRHWQGYLLPTGLPTDEKKRNRIIPTKELISKQPQYMNQDETIP